MNAMSLQRPPCAATPCPHVERREHQGAGRIAGKIAAFNFDWDWAASSRRTQSALSVMRPFTAMHNFLVALHHMRHDGLEIGSQ
jgi:hypothetical protein